MPRTLFGRKKSNTDRLVSDSSGGDAHGSTNSPANRIKPGSVDVKSSEGVTPSNERGFGRLKQCFNSSLGSYSSSSSNMGSKNPFGADEDDRMSGIDANLGNMKSDVREGNDEARKENEKDDQDEEVGTDTKAPIILEDTSLNKHRGDGVLSAKLAGRLKPLQKEGVKWMWDKYCREQGFILGDEPGFGKTRQVLALMAAIYGNDGSEEDFNRVSNVKKYGIPNEKRRPSLLVAPGNLIATWEEENGGSKTFNDDYTSPESDKAATHLGLWDFGKSLQRKNSKEGCAQKRKENFKELVCNRYGLGGTIDSSGTQGGKSKVHMVIVSQRIFIANVDLFSTVDWEIVVVEEAHEVYNKADTEISTKLFQLKEACQNSVFALITGTPYRNETKELFFGLRLVGKYLNEVDWTNKIWFDTHINTPLNKGHDLKANSAQSRAREMAFQLKNDIFGKVSLQRKKTDLSSKTGVQIVKKVKYIKMCGLSDIQRHLYEALLATPEVDIIRCSGEMCDCGCEQKRSKCTTYSGVPYASRENSNERFLDNAVVWKSLHSKDEYEDPEPCNKCPRCMCLALQDLMSKIISHPYLLHPNSVSDYEYTMAHPSASVMATSTGSTMPRYVEAFLQSSGVGEEIDAACKKGAVERAKLSAKMTTLLDQLDGLAYKKTVIFSESLVTLGEIEDCLKARGWGNRYKMYTGKMDSEKKDSAVKEFNDEDSGIFFLLATTKAGNVGVNLVAASNVIIYDLGWSPADLEQAENRAHRQNSKEDVSVFRYMCYGTLDEQKYCTHLKKASVGGSEENFSLSGNKKPEHRTGDLNPTDLYGMSNMLVYKPEPFYVPQEYAEMMITEEVYQKSMKSRQDDFREKSRKRPLEATAAYGCRRAPTSTSAPAPAAAPAPDPGPVVGTINHSVALQGADTLVSVPEPTRRRRVRDDANDLSTVEGCLVVNAGEHDDSHSGSPSPMPKVHTHAAAAPTPPQTLQRGKGLLYRANYSYTSKC